MCSTVWVGHLNTEPVRRLTGRIQASSARLAPRDLALTVLILINVLLLPVTGPKQERTQPNCWLELGQCGEGCGRVPAIAAAPTVPGAVTRIV